MVNPGNAGAAAANSVGGLNGVFRIGLTMAGGVSGGVYLAGVFDFLIEALEEWEKEKNQPGSTAPTHNVVISAMSGASAGAITLAMGTLVVASGIQPRPNPAPQQGGNPHLAYLPTLYDAWVKYPQLVAEQGSYLLGVEDLKSSKKIVSLLDSTVLGNIVNFVVGNSVAIGGAGKPYFATALPIYLMQSNMRGIPYSVRAAALGGGARFEHHMMAHADRELFKVTGLGSGAKPGPFADNDPSAVPLNTVDLTGSTTGAPWRRFTKFALASGAFPVGLEPRVLDMDPSSYVNRKWPLSAPSLHAGASPIQPSWNPAPTKYEYLGVDGGMFNNEPFEFARYALMSNPPIPNDRIGDNVDRAVIMSDPFPEPPEFDSSGGSGEAILTVALKRFLSAFMNQSRFKPAEIVEAVDEGVYSRYLIAPSRPGQTYGIACGLLSGFGGFLDWDFRTHDYQLGRRNCQRFLEEAFALPQTANLFAGRNPRAVSSDPTHAVIVPLCGTAKSQVAMPDWPRVPRARVVAAADKALARAKELVPQLLKEDLGLDWVARQYVALAWRLRGQSALRKLVYQTLQAGLVQRDQIAYEGRLAALKNLTDEQRKILGATCATNEEHVPLSKVVEDSRVAESTVRRFLDNQNIVKKKTVDGQACYLFAVLVDDPSP